MTTIIDNKDRSSSDHVERAGIAVEKVDGSKETAFTSDAIPPTVSPKEERRCLRKIDLYLMPMIVVTYALQYVDKVILNGASQFGIVQDLHLYEIKGYNPTTNKPIEDLHRFSLATLIFYWGYLAGGRSPKPSERQCPSSYTFINIPNYL